MEETNPSVLMCASIILLIYRTVTNMFIMNLAAADLLILAFCLPATVIQDVTKTWFFGLVLCKFINYIQVTRTVVILLRHTRARCTERARCLRAVLIALDAHRDIRRTELIFNETD